MPSTDLSFPSFANIDSPIRGVASLADDEVIGETILHSADTPVVMLHAADAVVAVDNDIVNNKIPAKVFLIVFPIIFSPYSVPLLFKFKVGRLSTIGILFLS